MTIIHPYPHAWEDWALSPEDVADALAGPEAEDIRLNVKRGAEWLAERNPHWADMIVAAVEDERFDLNVSCACAVGTVLGDYADHFGHLDESLSEGGRPTGEIDAEAVSLGFLVLDSADEDRAVRWAATEQAWVDHAYEQRAIR